MSLAMQTEAQTKPIYGLVIHGGAGAADRKNTTPEDERLRHAKLEEARDAGYAVLEKGGAATDAVIASINVMENAGMFDAGKGSVFNAEGVCELDASIMDGKTLAAGAVCAVQHIKNPITLARAVMDKSPHVLLAADGAEKFAKTQGFEMVPNSYFQTERRRKEWEKMKEKEKNPDSARHAHADVPDVFGTVGCVALDKNGNLAAGTSTGGLANKLPGRIGDSPIIGAGTYAKNSTCAVSGTGQGEYYIRQAFAHTISALMEYKGMTVQEAAAQAIKNVASLGGQGGCIALDRNAQIAMPFNTPAMNRAFKFSDGRTGVELFGEK
jgi:L-asparaginase / beta-aspartyl-peptidase